jgi:hypothetical protein
MSLTNTSMLAMCVRRVRRMGVLPLVARAIPDMGRFIVFTGEIWINNTNNVASAKGEPKCPQKNCTFLVHRSKLEEVAREIPGCGPPS